MAARGGGPGTHGTHVHRWMVIGVCLAALSLWSLGTTFASAAAASPPGRRTKRRPKEESNDMWVQPGFSVLVDFEMRRADTAAPLKWKDIPSPLSFEAEAKEVPDVLDQAVLGMVCGESKRLLAYGEPDEGGEELWEFSNEKTEQCDLPLTLDITLLKFEVKQDTRGVVVQRTNPGDGITYPRSGDRISVHYVGKLAANGKQFDSTYDRRFPFTFKVGLGQVIPGWDMAMMKLSQGEKAILTIPAALAYGTRGYGKLIPPNSDLIFEVHLMKVSRY